jgi:hypothetical protein
MSHEFKNKRHLYLPRQRNADYLQFITRWSTAVASTCRSQEGAPATEGIRERALVRHDAHPPGLRPLMNTAPSAPIKMPPKQTLLKSRYRCLFRAQGMASVGYRLSDAV